MPESTLAPSDVQPSAILMRAVFPPVDVAPDPGSEPRLSGWRASAILLAYFVAQLVMNLALGVGVGLYIAVAEGVAPHAESPIEQLVARAMMPIALIGVAFGGVVAFRMTRRTLHGSLSIGALASIGWRRPTMSHTAAAALLGCLAFLLYVVVAASMGPPTKDQVSGPLATAAASGGWPRFLWAFLALFIAPPIEEFVFRGVFLEGLRRSLGLRAAAVIVTVVFVVMHAAEAGTYWPAWIGLTGAALAALFVRLRTESLVPAICLHAAYNLCIVVSVFVASVWK